MLASFEIKFCRLIVFNPSDLSKTEKLITRPKFFEFAARINAKGKKRFFSNNFKTIFNGNDVSLVHNYTTVYLRDKQRRQNPVKPHKESI